MEFHKTPGYNILLVLSLAVNVAIVASGCNNSRLDQGGNRKTTGAPVVKRTNQDSEGLKKFKLAMRPKPEDFKLSNAVTPIVNPMPTHIENKVPITELEKIVDVSTNIDDEHFMVKPMFLAADDEGNIYVLDVRMKMIFKLSNTGKYLASFSEAGVGPGQFDPQGKQIELCFSREGVLNVSDAMLSRFTVFSPAGRFLRDYKINLRDSNFVSCFPVMSPKGDIFIRTGVGSTLDVYRASGVAFEFQYRLLGGEFFKKTLHYPIRRYDEEYFASTNPDTMSCHPAPDGRLLVYLHAMSELIIFNQDHLEQRFYLWPDRMLARHIQSGLPFGARNPEELGETIFYPSLFGGSFFDHDDDTHLYLCDTPPKIYLSVMADPRKIIYKFSRRGQLKEIFYSRTFVRFMLKKNGLFYGITMDDYSVQVYRPKKKPGRQNEE